MKLDFSVAANTLIGQQLVSGVEAYEPEVVNLMKLFLGKYKHDVGGASLVAHRQLFIDIGSNIGYFPLLATRYAQENGILLDCFAHEPLPELAATARALAQANKADYSLSTTALSNFQGTADFFVSAKSDASNSLVQGFRREKDIITVEVSTLDAEYAAVLDAVQYAQIILMIDVETAEPAVLEGARRTIVTHRPVIICEVLAGRTEAALSVLFNEFGYKSFRFDGQRWIEEPAVMGDASHKFRDWLFVPSERGEEFETLLELDSY